MEKQHPKQQERTSYQTNKLSISTKRILYVPIIRVIGMRNMSRLHSGVDMSSYMSQGHNSTDMSSYTFRVHNGIHISRRWIRFEFLLKSEREWVIGDGEITREKGGATKWWSSVIGFRVKEWQGVSIWNLASGNQLPRVCNWLQGLKMETGS